MTDQAKDPRPCGDCGALPGALHLGGCDVESCCLCGGQAISCNCVYVVNGMNVDTLEDEHPEIFRQGATAAMIEALEAEEARWGGRLPWTGEFVGVEECRVLGLWSYWGGIGLGWVPCTPDHPGAMADRNRLYAVAQWDRRERRFVAPDSLCKSS